MSRDDQIFTKRGIVLVAALSTLGGWAIQALVAGWRTRDEMAKLEDVIVQKATVAATAAAVAAVQATVEPVKVDLASHKGSDTEMHRAETQRIDDLKEEVRALRR